VPGILFNCFIMATVNLAACKIAAVLSGFDRWQTLLAVGLLNVVFAAHSGLWGVLAVGMARFFIKMPAAIAAAYFAVTLPQVGGGSYVAPRMLASKSEKDALGRPASSTWRTTFCGPGRRSWWGWLRSSCTRNCTTF
jgi:Na+/proline symporter